MSNAVLTRVWKQSKQKSNHRLLIVAIADVVNNHGVGYAGNEYLAEMIALSERQTRRLLHDLESWGEVYIKLGNGRGIKTQYLVCVGLEDSELQFALENYFEMTSEEAKNVSLSVIEKRGTFLNKRGTNSIQKGDKKRVKGDTVKRKSRTTINHRTKEPIQKPAVSDEVKQKRKPDPIFDWVAQNIFQVTPDSAHDDPDTNKWIGANAAKLVNAEKKKLGIPEKTPLTDKQRVALASQLPGLLKHYLSKSPGLNPPKAKGKFATLVLQWYDAGKPFSTASQEVRYTPVEHDDYVAPSEVA